MPARVDRLDQVARRAAATPRAAGTAERNDVRSFRLDMS